MADRESLLGLAFKVEAATGEDRELDAAVWWEAVGKHADTDGDLIPRFEANPAKALDYWCGAGWRQEFQFPPRYTASVDAAMSLVPEGWGYQIMPLMCTLKHPKTQRRDIDGFGSTPALAIAGACLRARAALVEE